MTATHQTGNPDIFRKAMRKAHLADEAATLRRLVEIAALSPQQRDEITARTCDLIRMVRRADTPLMDSFMAEYGLSNKEGVALMRLAEALPRIPDEKSIDALINDKIAAADWRRHLGRGDSPLVNASTWALMLTGKILEDTGEQGLMEALHGALRRLGEPVVRAAMTRAVQEMGRRFVLGGDIDAALNRAAAAERDGYRFSYDMLGEAARCEADAQRYHLAYANAVSRIAARGKAGNVQENPGLSVKLSALHPRYEPSQRSRVVAELADRTLALAVLAKNADIGFTIDAEEAERLDLSLDVIEAVLASPALAGWDGFGIVVQAFGRRAVPLLDWIYAVAQRLDRRLAVRLVKGAYWDGEIKRAQLLGLGSFPVFTRKAASDISYIACARKLAGMADRIYPQYATHNAHTVEAVLQVAGDGPFEFQRLHGMGEDLHEVVKRRYGRPCRIYAPVGQHRDLLAYLVRRLLENGANSSFVNGLMNRNEPPENLAADPFALMEALGDNIANPVITPPAEIFGGARRNSKGWDLSDPDTVTLLTHRRAAFDETRWRAFPAAAAGREPPQGELLEIRNPAQPQDLVGAAHHADAADIDAAFTAAGAAQGGWAARPAAERAAILTRLADLYEDNTPELMALLAREAGKTWPDAIGEIREAVDFCRYYALQALRRSTDDGGRRIARGVFVCISPWNFPLAIFTGQVAAALAAGNAVIAKPAEQTPLIAARAVQLAYEAGAPREILHLVPGEGETVGAALVGDPRADGVCFTGSTATARHIHQTLANKGNPTAPLIAETGGLNAMIVDSTALPEQVVRDVLSSAFQSAGQRCSALRMLYLQEEIAPRVLEMLCGAMDMLQIGDPRLLSTDIGPVIDAAAKQSITAHCRKLEKAGRLLHRLQLPKGLQGNFVAPAVFRVEGIEALKEEIFGPVLHVAAYAGDRLMQVVQAINNTGYALTFGMHSRVDRRVRDVAARITAGNIYVNRDQIGAVVGSQPFGGRGLSGTGPKAGGPFYLDRFTRPAPDRQARAPRRMATPVGPGGPTALKRAAAAVLDQAAAWNAAPPETRLQKLRAALPEDAGLRQAAESIVAACAPRDLPGPTGESNRLLLQPRGLILVVGAAADMLRALIAGNPTLAAGVEPELITALQAVGAPLAGVALPDGKALQQLPELAAVILPPGLPEAAAIRAALAARRGPITLMTEAPCDPAALLHEQTICMDITAAGGDPELLATAG